MSTLAWIILGVVVLIVLSAITAYNGLIALRNRVKEAWSDISVQLKRRYDLIPNLIATVKGYAKHEKEVFTQVTAARTTAMGASGLAEKGKAEGQLTKALKSIFAVAENYPDLKASQNFLNLQDELTDTENKIEAARRFYNGQVRDFNTKLQVFPTNLIGKQLGFASEQFFGLDAGEVAAAQNTPKVKF